MCMSVPQIAVLAISIRASFGPTFGSGMSSSQMPGAACCLTSAFMGTFAGRGGGALDDLELAADTREGRDRLLELRAAERGRHLRADARLALGHDREGEADDVHALGEQLLGHAAGERGVADHDRD